MKQTIKCGNYTDTDLGRLLSNYTAGYTMMFKPKEELKEYLNLKFGKDSKESEQFNNRRFI